MSTSNRKESILSDVARIRRQIEVECEAMRLAMSGFRIIGSHDIINHQFDQLGVHYECLEKLIGEQAAIEVVIGALDASIEPKGEETRQ